MALLEQVINVAERGWEVDDPVCDALGRLVEILAQTLNQVLIELGQIDFQLHNNFKIFAFSKRCGSVPEHESGGHKSKQKRWDYFQLDQLALCWQIGHWSAQRRQCGWFASHDQTVVGEESRCATESNTVYSERHNWRYLGKPYASTRQFLLQQTSRQQQACLCLLSCPLANRVNKFTDSVLLWYVLCCAL